MGLEKGKIKTLITEKGFGFIRCEALGKDLFFHATSLDGVGFVALKVGDEVEFYVERGEKGDYASQVRVV